jgi:hypothetical protein
MVLTNSKKTVDYRGGVTQAANWESDPGQMVRCVFCGGPLCRSCSKDAVLLCERPAIPGTNQAINLYLSTVAFKGRHYSLSLLVIYGTP